MSDALKAGTQIGGLEIRSVLGAGGFGITYDVVDLSTGVHYALKEYFPAELAKRAADNSVTVDDKNRKVFDTGLDAFYNEAQLLRTLPRTDGLMSVRGLFKRHGTACVVMELVEGKSLTELTRSYVRNNRHFPEDLIRDFLGSIGGALAQVHSTGLIHRDIKPDNIMVRRSDGQPILIDFGAARELRGQVQDAVMYTPSYAAYEQVPKKAGGPTRKMPEGPWTDIFSLCVVLYVMMTGQKPPNAVERGAALRKGLPDPYVPVDQKSGGRYSEVLCNLVDSGCQLEPRSRPQSADRVLSLLGIKRKFAAAPRPAPKQNPLGPSQDDPVRPQPEYDSSPTMSVQAKRLAFIAAGFVLVLYLLLVYYGIA